MSGSLASIFSGQPTPPQPTGADTSTNYPAWLQDYTYNLANAATNLAQSQYTPVPFPEVAAPSGATQQAWQMALNNVGNYQGALNQANNLTGTAANLALGNTGYQGTLQGALNYANAGASPITSSQINQYMSPYTNQVVGALQQASNNNLFQNVLPQVQQQFVSAGQAASPQQMQATNNAIYQSNQALDQSTASALQSGYQGALNTALAEQQAQQTGASQLSNIGQLQQQLGASNANQIAALGAQQGQLGALTQQLGAFDVGQVAASGQGQDTTNQANINAALNNFYAQQQWPYQNLAYASNVIRGQYVPSNTTTVGMNYVPGQTYTASPIQSFVSGALGGAALSGNNSNSAATTPAAVNGNQSSAGGGLAKGGIVRLRRAANDQAPGALSRYLEAA